MNKKLLTNLLIGPHFFLGLFVKALLFDGSNYIQNVVNDF